MQQENVEMAAQSIIWMAIEQKENFCCSFANVFYYSHFHWIIKVRNCLSAIGGWLQKRGSCHAESRQIQMQTLQKCICLRGHVENSCDDSALQNQLLLVQPVWISQNRSWWQWNANNIRSICTDRHLEEIFEKSIWRKIAQMQPMWLCILLRNKFEATYKNPLCREITQMQPMCLCILLRN